MLLKPRLRDESWLARVKTRGCAPRRFMLVMHSSTGCVLKRLPLFYLHETPARAFPALYSREQTCIV
jgi:hypothetical protein